MMKKGTKEILSGVLALSIVLCTPACMAAEAIGQQGAVQTGDGGDTAGYCFDQSEVSITISEDPSEIISEQLPDEILENLPENNPETESEDISPNISEANPKVNSEEYAELESSAKEEGELEGSREEESNPEANSKESIELEGSTEEENSHTGETNSETVSEESTEIERGTEEYTDNSEANPEEIIESESSTAEESTDNSDRNLEESTELEGSTEEESTDNLDRNPEESTKSEGSTEEESTEIEGGTEEYTDNSEANPEESTESEGSTEEQCSNNDETDSGESTEMDGGTEESTELENSTKEERTDNFDENIYDETIYIEGVDNNAEVETQEQDIYAPMLKELWVESKRYEAASSDSEQFIVKNFVLKGTFCGKVNRVNRIEYTTNLQPEKDSVWLEAKSTQTTESKVTETEFQIALPEGSYPSIAVRAYDEAGNVSGVGQLVSDSGESLQVVVEHKDNTADRTAQDQSAGQPAIKRTIKLKTTKPELSESTVTNAEISKLEVAKPESIEPEVTNPEVTKPDAIEPEVTKPDAAETQVRKPEVIIPEVLCPEISDFKDIKLDHSNPEAPKQETARLDEIQQKNAKPSLLKQEATKSDLISKVLLQPEELQSQISELQNTIKTADMQTSISASDYLLSDKMVDNSNALNANTLLVDEAPEIQISFHDSAASSENIYRQKRTATVRVLEADFDPAAVSIPITRDNRPIEVKLSDWTSDGNEHYATFELAEEGEYSIAASNGNQADQTETFIIDRVAPKMTVDLVPAKKPQTAFNAVTENAAVNNTVQNDSFNTKVTAVIRVTEHNFREEDFALNMPAVSEKGTWSHDGDVHTLQISFDKDDAYHLECAYADLYGNSVKAIKRDFLIDTAAPTIIIDGVENNSANNRAICPVISVEDSNMELSDISVSVMTGTGDLVQSAIDTELVSSENGTGYRLTLTDIAEQPDNVYHLCISACDKAGNVAEQAYRFSLNQHGSVYDLASLKQLTDQKYSTYKALNDIQIVEMNMDPVEDFELYISRNGALGYKAEYTKEICGSADVGYTYLYRINKENFAEEGTYRLTMYSKDRAGNEVNNATDINGDEITFVVDNTAPKVVIDGVESGMVYKVESQKVHVAVIDNFKLDEAELFLVNEANEVLKRWDYIALAGEDGALDITIPQYSGKLSLLYRVKDATGNEVQTLRGDAKAPSDFIVNANKFVTVSMNLTIIFMTGVSGLSVILFLVLISRKRHN